MKMSDGMFLAACREVSKDFPNVQYDEDLLDRACLQVRSLAAYAKFEEVLMTSPIDRPKSEAVRGPRDGDAQLVRRYPLRHVRWPYRWSWLDALWQHRSRKCTIYASLTRAHQL